MMVTVERAPDEETSNESLTQNAEDNLNGATKEDNNQPPQSPSKGKKEVKPAQINDNLTSTLTCCICHQLYRDPYRTACMHAFCLECITPMLQANPNLPCPLCRTIPITPLKRDFLLIQLKDELTGMKCLPAEESAPASTEDTYSKPAPPIFSGLGSAAPAFTAGAAPAVIESVPAAAPVGDELQQRFRVEDIFRRPNLLVREPRNASRSIYRKLLFRPALWTALVLADNIIKWFVYADAIHLQNLHEAGAYKFNFLPTRDAYLAMCIWSTLITLFCYSKYLGIPLVYYSEGSLREQIFGSWRTPFMLLRELFIIPYKRRSVTKVSFWISHEKRTGRELLYFFFSICPLLVMDSLLVAKSYATPALIVAIVLQGVLFIHFFIYGDKQPATSLLFALYRGLRVSHGNPETLLTHFTSLNGSEEFDNWNKIKNRAKWDKVAHADMMALLSDNSGGAGSDITAALLIFLYAVSSTGGTAHYFDASTIRTLYERYYRLDTAAAAAPSQFPRAVAIGV